MPPAFGKGEQNKGLVSICRSKAFINIKGFAEEAKGVGSEREKYTVAVYFALQAA